MARSLAVFTGVLLLAAELVAAPKLAALFTDHAVLQRGVPVPVWGSAAPGERVELSYRDIKISAVADASGRWRVTLPVMDVGAPAELSVRGDGTVSARDVVVGDVWVISGQSNMAWPLSKDDGGQEALAGPELPWLRELKVPSRVAEQDAVDTAASWDPADARSAGAFSAVGYYFARHLYPDGSVPVGLVNASAGGTVIEAWMGPGALRASVHGGAVASRWSDVLARYPEAKARYDVAMAEWTEGKNKAVAAGEKYAARAPSRPVGPGHAMQPSGLYHGMIAPLMPAAVRGVVWYQGESNVVRPSEYADLLGAMMKDWRSGFQNAGLPFYIVQLPKYADPKFSWAEVRLGQAKAVAEDPCAHLIVTIDQGDSRDKHPRSKSEVGRRIARSVSYHDFGDKRSGDAPTLKRAWRDGLVARLVFESGGERLVFRQPESGRVSFQLAGPDGKFVPAQAEFNDGVVSVRAETVREPTRLRYLDDNNPSPSLFSESGLCVGPFLVEQLETQNGND